MLEIKNSALLTSCAPDIFTPEALAFVEKIVAKFSARRDLLLDARRATKERFDSGQLPGFLPDTKDLRMENWTVTEAPAVLQNRQIEITAPAERQKVIQALNSSAKVYMADFEDSLVPTWKNIIAGQQALYDAVRGACDTVNPDTGKKYTLNSAHECILIVRPRGWHLPEKNICWQGRPVAGAFVDFGLFFFHNAKLLAARECGPYFYLPKTEHWREAALWNDIMDFSEAELALPINTTKATLMIETLPAVFQMHEILHAMRNRLVGLNSGRWDYIFSYIKTLSHHPQRILPARGLVTMDKAFLKAYSEELVETCHRRGAHAMGGMSAFIPIRGDEKANAAALEKVREDKIREAANGYDGTWVAHPTLIDVAAGAFSEYIQTAHQKDKLFGTAHSTAILLALPEGDINHTDFDTNIQVALRYIAAWLEGVGAVSIFNMMEDTATAEVARAQLWQWLKYSSTFSDGTEINTALFANRLQAAVNDINAESAPPHLNTAADMLDSLVNAPDITDFLTIGAYALID